MRSESKVLSMQSFLRKCVSLGLCWAKLQRDLKVWLLDLYQARARLNDGLSTHLSSPLGRNRLLNRPFLSLEWYLRISDQEGIAGPFFALQKGPSRIMPGAWCEDPRPHAWSMCATCLCPCIFSVTCNPSREHRSSRPSFLPIPGA